MGTTTSAALGHAADLDDVLIEFQADKSNQAVSEMFADCLGAIDRDRKVAFNAAQAGDKDRARRIRIATSLRERRMMGIASMLTRGSIDGAKAK